MSHRPEKISGSLYNASRRLFNIFNAEIVDAAGSPVTENDVVQHEPLAVTFNHDLVFRFFGGALYKVDIEKGIDGYSVNFLYHIVVA